MSTPHETPRREIARFMRRLYARGLTTTSGGNISILIEDDLLAISPAGLDKGRLCADQVALMRLEGRLLSGPRPTSEWRMHARILQRRPDVRAIVHAHPPVACAFSAARTPINTRLTGEPWMMLGEIGRAPYALTGSDELAEAAAEVAAGGAQALLLDNHGVVALGATLLEAFDRLELVEAAARITLTARQLGGCSELNPVQCAELDRLVGRSPA